MSHARKLTSPKTTGKTPSGRQSWKDAQNQAQGNINWMLEFMEAEEIISKIVKSESKDIREIYPPKKRMAYLVNLENYLEKSLEQCRDEKDKLEQITGLEPSGNSEETNSWL